jgi:predicted acyltransferase
VSDAPTIAGRERLVALDAFRGATVAAMLLVNNPGSWAHVHAPLRHAEWHGWTPTDLIFPFFLFVVGLTTHLAIERRIEDGASRRAMLAKIVRRGALIVLLGLALNAFPFFAPGTIPGAEDPSVIDRVGHQFETMRIPGVLQRIGVVYVLVGLWACRSRKPGARGVVTAVDAAVIATILCAYWALLTLVPVPGSGVRGSEVMAIPGETLAAWSDRLVFGASHLWSQSKTWDPEGALSTLPALATALLGLLAGRWLTSEHRAVERVRVLVLAGTCLTVAGLMWDRAFPINKSLWTSSYVVFTAGAAMIGIAIAFWATDMKGWRRATLPLVAFGVNPMLAFFGSGIMARALTLVKVELGGRTVSIQSAVHETLFASWLPDKWASLAYAGAFVLVWLAILWPLWKRGWIWKV